MKRPNIAEFSKTHHCGCDECNEHYYALKKWVAHLEKYIKQFSVFMLMDQRRQEALEQLSSIARQIPEDKLNEEMRRLGYGRSSSDIIIRYEEDLIQARLDLARSLFDYRLSLVALDLIKNTLLDQYWSDEL